ncbi:MAG: hypothetical protein E7554_07955 [Ruminococcaceae bacterium]|nr:hypothetical protein [Oscillospiraceae bacterium]
MKKIITAALACAMIISSLCACGQEQPGTEPATLPEKYSLADEGLLTPPENDPSIVGMCLFFSLLDSCESNLIKGGYETAHELNLSEAYQYYCTFSFDEDRDSGEDGYYIGNDRQDTTNCLGPTFSEMLAQVSMFANGCGPVDESVIGFDAAASIVDDMDMTDMNSAHTSGSIEKYMGEYLLTGIDFNCDCFFEPVYQNASTEEMKRSILENGAAAVQTTTAQSNIRKSEAGIAYYQNNYPEDIIYEYMNHSVSVVGWDDSFSRENFGYIKPENDGAWLVRDNCRKYGEYYYWISYEQLLAAFVTVDFGLREDYGDILYYDSIGMKNSIKAEGGETVAANVFTVDEDCTLSAVGVPTSAQDQPVTVEVYRNPDKDMPDSGVCAAVLETTIHKPGYHVVDLDEAVKLSEGDSFSIVIRYPADSTGANEWLGRVPVEGEYRQYAGDIIDMAEHYGFELECVLTSAPGQSYVVYDGKWYDTSEPATAELFGLDVTLNNFGIKALMEKE